MQASEPQQEQQAHPPTHPTWLPALARSSKLVPSLLGLLVGVQPLLPPAAAYAAAATQATQASQPPKASSVTAPTFKDSVKMIETSPDDDLFDEVRCFSFFVCLFLSTLLSLSSMCVYM